MTFVKRLRLVMLILFMSLSAWNTGISQNSDDAKEVTTTYYIKNAFVVQEPGTVLSNTSILIKDGLIQGIGPDITVPFDAKVVNADSMYVYAGFIDACSHVGIAVPDKKDRPKVDNPGNPPRKLAGITPQQTVRAAMGDQASKTMKEMRDLGFGYIHIVPRGRMLPGQGSVLSTGKGKPDQTLIKENISQFAQFKPARRMFPSTTIGVMSQFRDLYKNATYSHTYLKSYDLNPAGLERPNHSEELAALFPVVNQKMPVYFYATKVKDVNRAMILQKELGFDMVLTGMRQAWPLLDEIAAGGYEVILSLHLPEKIEDPTEKEEQTPEKKKEDEEEKTKEKDEAESVEIKLLKEKKKKAHDEYVGQAARFEKQGFAFSFSSLDTKTKDIRPNLLRMIEGGLSEDAALAALTTNPAKLLGIDNVAGTIEKGKIANLLITDKPYFEKESKIKFLVNDGMLKEFEEKKKKKDNGEEVSIEGTWSYKVSIPDGEQTGEMVIKGSGDDINIKINSADEPEDYADATNVALDGNTLTFDITVENIPYSLSITFTGADFEGTVSVADFGSFPLNGTLKEGPE